MSLSSKILSLAVLFLTIHFSSTAQLEYEGRIEIELDGKSEGEEIYMFAENGFITQFLEDGKKGMNNLVIEWYDTEMESTYQKTELVSDKMWLDEQFSDDYRCYALFKDKKGRYELVTADAEKKKTYHIRGEFPKKSVVKELAVLGDFVYFNTVIKKAPVLYAINWKTGLKKPIAINIDGHKPKKTAITDFQLLEKSREIILFGAVNVSKDEFDTYILRLNEEGKTEMTFNLTKNIKNNLHGISAQKLDDEGYVYTGTYSDNNKKTGKSKGAGATGIFFCETDGKKIEYINYVNFTDMKDFLTYLPEKKQAKIEKKKKKKAAKGKEYKLSYRIAAHEVIKQDDGYVLVGEAFYPTYRTETYTTTDANGNTVTRTRQVFDGYQYTHAFIAKFDEGGEMVWDKCFEMWPSYKPFRVIRFISIGKDKDDAIKLAFVNHNRIVTIAYDNDGDEISKKESETIKAAKSGDVAKWTIADVKHWYDDYFLAYGRQKIKNKDKSESGKKKRKVYFVSKMSFN